MFSFLASEFPPAAPNAARFHIIPAPMELSVSYGSGAANGPAAILKASQQLEAFDGHSYPGDAGIYTAPVITPSGGSRGRSPSISARGGRASSRAAAERWLESIEHAVASALTCHAIHIVLGGEHTVTLGTARAFKKAGRDIGFLHFDAHADLRDTYEGSPFSHACVMRRVHELGFPIVQLATRAYSREERDYRDAHPKTLRAYDAEDIANNQVPDNFLPENFPKEIYVTFDVDAWDPSLMPSTGTPVPGGLGWFEALRFIQSAAKTRRIVGADVVELAPIPLLPHADFTAARMVYALMGIVATASSH